MTSTTPTEVILPPSSPFVPPDGGRGYHLSGVAGRDSTARVERAPSERARSASKETRLTTPPLRYTVKYCFTCSALNSVLLPDTTTAPLAITTYFSARRAAKWSPCSTNKMANRR